MTASPASADHFRHAAGRFASGVTIVTTRVGSEVYGITCSSFASLSLDPPLVTASVNAYSPLLEHVRESRCFAVSVLARGQRHVSQYFATRDRGSSRDFGPIGTRTARTGAPVIDGCLSYFDCHLYDVLPGGDHRILIGDVTATGHDTTAADPLLYYAGGYRELHTADAAS